MACTRVQGGMEQGPGRHGIGRVQGGMASGGSRAVEYGMVQGGRVRHGPGRYSRVQGRYSRVQGGTVGSRAVNTGSMAVNTEVHGRKYRVPGTRSHRVG